MIRSAKMNEITPPKLMPPFHRTRRQRHVADRADEGGHARRAGPMIGPQILAAQWVAGEEQVLPEAVGYPGRGGAGDQQTDDQVAQHRRPLHDEVVADGR